MVANWCWTRRRRTVLTALFSRRPGHGPYVSQTLEQKGLFQRHKQRVDSVNTCMTCTQLIARMYVRKGLAYVAEPKPFEQYKRPVFIPDTNCTHLKMTTSCHIQHPIYVRPPNFGNIFGPFETCLEKRPPRRLVFPDDSDESVLADELCKHTQPYQRRRLHNQIHVPTISHLPDLPRSLEGLFGQVAVPSVRFSRSHMPVIAVAALFPLETVLLLLLLLAVPLVLFLALCQRRLPQRMPHALDLH